MQITIEDLSPVEKRVEFELPWADVVPKLEKAYDSLRRGVRLPGFRPGKVPRALLEKMYKRRVEVRSQVTPKDYTGVPLTRRPAGVTDEAVAEALEGYRRRLTEFKPVEG